VRDAQVWHEADVAIALSNVRFRGKADIVAKLLTKDEARRIAVNNVKLRTSPENGEAGYVT
jgi:hypothetical protein